MTITESKLDSSFRTTQFLIDGLSKPFRFDRNRNAVGVLLYVSEDIVCRKSKSNKFPNDIDGIFNELNLIKEKWIFLTYHPPSQSEDYYFSHVNNCLDGFSSTNDRFLLTGNFNAEDFKETLLNFLEKYNVVNIVKHKTCFKSLDNSSCIELFITNRTRPLFPQAYQIFIKWMLLP